MKEVLVTSYITKYEAIDGTQFTTKDECRKYEESAKGVLMGKYSHLIINKCIPEYTLFIGAGSEDYCYDIVKLEKESDIDIIMQLTFLDNPYLLQIENSEETCMKRSMVEIAYVTRQPLFIGRGDNSSKCFWPMFMRSELIDKILSYCNEDKITEEAED